MRWPATRPATARPSRACWSATSSKPNELKNQEIFKGKLRNQLPLFCAAGERESGSFVEVKMKIHSLKSQCGSLPCGCCFAEHLSDDMAENELRFCSSDDMILVKMKPVEEIMNEECLICKAPLTYLEADMLMECEICHKKENSKTRCVNGHYVCNECHTQGLDRIIELCMTSASRDPIAIIEQMMALPTCHMHGPEHHVMVGAALLTAYHNAGGDIDLRSALTEMMNRGRSVPGGACGFWGACGAGISTGMFVSIISQSTPLTNEPFALSHKMTAKSLQAISEIGGPRCCKRDSFLSILAAIDFVREQFGVEMEKSEVVCHYSAQNNQCIGKRCPFSKTRH